MEAEIYAQKTVSCHGSYLKLNPSLGKCGIYQNKNEIISVANGSKSSTAHKAYANSSHHLNFTEDCKVGTAVNQGQHLNIPGQHSDHGEDRLRTIPER